jgi:uncharacterized membrane protein YczE
MGVPYFSYYSFNLVTDSILFTLVGLGAVVMAVVVGTVVEVVVEVVVTSIHQIETG